MFRKLFSGLHDKLAGQPKPRDNRADNSPALIASVQNGDLNRVMQLVQAGADLELRDERNATALHYAVCGHHQIAEFLLAHGAGTEATDSDGFAPLHVAFLRHDKAMLELLVKHGADMNKPLPDGRTIRQAV